MAFTPQLTNAFFLIALLVVLLPSETYAFGAGDIPDFAYLNDKAFRHGDIENILETLVKTSGAAIGGSGLFGFASSVIKHSSGGSKFTKSDVKKVYFGNWLRDYSQAMDIAGLSKLSADTLVLIVSVLGFMTFGFASDEFQITADRLGVYLPVEHIDNPKGYAEKEGDARTFHPKLRPPVSPKELEIDSKTGMKKYIATENQGWDTSTAFIRRTFRACIEHGRRAQGNEGAELWEAYRLLGTGLHTMEDLLAHSNWCELALRKLGHSEVFCHVGDNVVVNTPNGRAPPLVTGTFGSADFMHSVLGEAGDKLSQASVTELSAKIDNGSKGNVPDLSFLKGLMGKLGGGSDKLEQGEEIKKQSQAYNFNPDNIAPPEVQRQLLDLLKWHDDIFRSVNNKIEMIPGLTNLMEEFSNALNEYIYTILAPYLGPILTQATGILNEGSKAVIDSDDQYEVFDNANASDPSHSLLSKDHFGLILNEPAGKIAQVVVENSVNLIVKAWGNDENDDQVITQILEAFHHPYYASGRSEIQRKMIGHMAQWIGGLGSESAEILQSLTKQSVRDHKNKRPGLDSDIEEAGYGGCGHGHKPSKTTGTSSSGYAQQTAPSTYKNTQSTYNSVESKYNQQPTHTSTQSFHNSETYGKTQTSGVHASERRDTNNSYGQQRRQDGEGRQEYGEGRQEYSGQDQQDSAYGRQDRQEYGGQVQQESTHGLQGREEYGGQPQQDSTYGRQGREEYGAQAQQSSAYVQPGRQEHGGYRSQENQQQNAYGGQQQHEAPSYGTQGHQAAQASYAAHSESYAPSYSRPEESSYDRSDQQSGGYQQSQPSPAQGRGGHNGESSHGGSNQLQYGGSGNVNQPSYGRGGGDHGQSRRRDDSDSDDDKRKKKRGDDSDDEHKSRHQHGGGGYGGGQQQEYRQQASSGYAPSHGGRDDTFGAERLDIGGRQRRDDSDDDDNKKHGSRHGHGGDRY